MSAFYVVCYDVRDARRLRRVANDMENFGVRVQKSVFECYLDGDEMTRLKRQVLRWIDPKEDHVRYYPLCGKDKPGILLDGPGTISANPDYHLV
ncbi:MAG: CRISPR-associated endonuclease Cas2 [Methylococcales bacterium]